MRLPLQLRFEFQGGDSKNILDNSRNSVRTIFSRFITRRLRRDYKMINLELLKLGHYVTKTREEVILGSGEIDRRKC
jgi:hypothetical protein